jgi:hypothetical protein
MNGNNKPYNATPTDYGVESIEKKLRAVKGEEFTTQGRIQSVDVYTGDEPQHGEKTNVCDEDDFGDIVVRFGVKTPEGRKILLKVKPPTSSWDMTNELVVLLEYLELEPENLHTVGRGEDDDIVPVSFNFEEEEYEVDFTKMRDSVFDREEKE